MKNNIFLPLSLLALVGLTMPGSLSADCIPSAPVGYSVPFTLVTLKSYASGGSQFVAYTNGSLTYTAHNLWFAGTTLSGNNNRQVFSDRFVRPCGQLICEQQFNANEADLLGVTISDGRSLILSQPASIQVTFTLQSWGNAQSTATATCDATSGELLMTGPGGISVMTFGTPTPPPPTQ